MIPPEIKAVIKDFFEKNWKMALLILSLVIVGYASLLWLPKDNPIEQAAEKVIEDETGIKVDLTP